jgi:hypothetical protein
MQLMAGGRQMLRMDEGTDPDRLRFVTDDNWTDSSGNWNMSGSLTVVGNIAVSGTVDGVDIAALNTTVSDKVSKAGDTMTGNLLIATGATESGIRFRGATLDFVGRYSNYVSLYNELNSNQELKIPDSGLATLGGNPIFTDAYHPNADTLTTARNIALTGAVTGNADFNGSGNISITTTHTADPVITLTGAVTGSGTMTNLGSVSITTTATSDPVLTLAGDATGSATFTNLGNATLTVAIVDDSHNHIISNVDGLQSALDLKLNTSLKGANSGLAELDSSGKVPASQLPSYVDDVVMFDPLHNTLRFASTNPTGSTAGSLNEILYSFQSSLYYCCSVVSPPSGYVWTSFGGGGTIPADGFETGKIYVTTTSNKTYRWSSGQPKDGSIVEISASLALGSTSATAHRGDHGATAYTHSQVINGTNPHGTTFANIASKPTTLSGFGITDAEPAFTKNTGFNKNFGTTAGTVTQGNDARLSNARTPTAHTHGNITNAGAIGSTTNLVVVTGTSGVLTTATRSGIDSRTAFPTTYANITGTVPTWNQSTTGNASTATTLQNARTINGVSFNGSANITITAAPNAHTHGNITNAGAIGSTSDLVVVTGASGVLTTSSRSGIDSRSSFPPAGHAISTHSDVSISSPTSGQVLKWNGLAWTNQADNNTTYTLGSFGVTSTAAELNILDGVTSTASELNVLDGITATTTELNYTDGVTSNIQTQLNSRLPIPGSPYYSPTTNSILKFNTTFGWTTTAKQYDWHLIRNHTGTFVLDNTNALGTTGGSASVTVSLAAGDVLMMELSPYNSVIAGYTVPIVIVRLGGTDTTPTSLQQGTLIKEERFSSTTRYQFTTKVSGSGSTLYFDDTFRMQFLDTSTAASIMTEASSNLYIGKVWRLTI